MNASASQIDMFPIVPEIKNLGITRFRLDGAELKAELEGAVNVNDIARIDDRAWINAVAQWLLVLCQGDRHTAITHINGVALQEPPRNAPQPSGHDERQAA